MLVCWKQVPPLCHSLIHPNPHLRHYQNKETFASCQRLPLMLPVMTRDLFHGGVCSSVSRKWVLSFWKKMCCINCLLHSYLLGSRVLELVSEFMWRQSPCPIEHRSEGNKEKEKEHGFGGLTTWFKSYLYHSLTPWPWASYLASLGVTYPCHKTEMVVALNLWGCDKN